MDLNLVVLSGQLAATPEVRSFPSGSCMVRYLVTTRSTVPRRRVDVVPVTLWDPGDHAEAPLPERGAEVWVAGAVQRRFWASGDGTRSRLEVVAHHVEFRDAGHGESDDAESVEEPATA